MLPGERVNGGLQLLGEWLPHLFKSLIQAQSQNTKAYLPRLQE
jgi:hypothetical protein